ILPAMTDLPSRIRAACATVAQRAHHVSIAHDAIVPYASNLPLDARATQHSDPGIQAAQHADPGPPGAGGPEDGAAFWLTLDAINFGSGWFPTLPKRPGPSGYAAVAAAVPEPFVTPRPA